MNKLFNSKDVLTPFNFEKSKDLLNKLCYFGSSKTELIANIVKDNKMLLKQKFDGGIDCYCAENGEWYSFCIPCCKVKAKETEQTGKQKYSKNRNTFDLWIANKVKVRVVTNVDNFDKTLFSILGVIEKCEKQGILLKDQNNKKHFICYPNILEVQYLGTDDWKEYLGLSIDEIDNV